MVQRRRVVDEDNPRGASGILDSLAETAVYDKSRAASNRDLSKFVDKDGKPLIVSQGASQFEEGISDQAKMLIRFAMGTEEREMTRAGTKSWNRARGAQGMWTRSKVMVAEAEREEAARAADAKERDEHVMKTHYMPAKLTVPP